MKYSRECKMCGNSFETNNVKKLTCSDDCGRQLQAYNMEQANLRVREKRREDNNKKYEHILDIPSCRICGWKSTSLQNHLKTHKLTVQQYKEQYQVANEEIFHSSYTQQKRDRISGEKNPGYQHNGTMSSFSRNFKQYNELTEDHKRQQISAQIAKANKSKRANNSYTTTLEYYTTRGFSVVEADILRKQRQSTFSLELCINKYGKEKGIECWINRQEKWLESEGMKSLSMGVSKISQQLFVELEPLIVHRCYYATNGLDHTINNEYKLRTLSGLVKLDFFVPGIGKIIEFDGDYWHSDKNPRKICSEIRDSKILQTFPTYNILHIWEGEYKRDKLGTIQKCLKFLNE